MATALQPPDQKQRPQVQASDNGSVVRIGWNDKKPMLFG
jgi:hypothetical protein